MCVHTYIIYGIFANIYTSTSLVHISPAQCTSEFPKRIYTHACIHAFTTSMRKMRFASTAATQPIALHLGHATTSCSLGNAFHLKIADWNKTSRAHYMRAAISEWNNFSFSFNFIILFRFIFISQTRALWGRDTDDR